MMKMRAENISLRLRIYLLAELRLQLRLSSSSSGDFFSLASSYLSDLVIQTGTQDGFLDQTDHTCLSLVPSRDILGHPELPPTRASLIAGKHSATEPTHQPVGTFSNEPLNGKCTDNTGIKWAPLIDFPNQYGTGAPSLCHLLPLPGGILRPFIILIRHYTWHKCWVD